PAVVLLQHRAVVAPRSRVRERPLRVGDAGDTGADSRVVAIAADDLPRAAVREADEHFVVVGRLAKRMRKGFVDAALAGVRVDRSPDRLAALQKLREAVPVVAGALHRARRSVVQTDFVLAGATVPHRHRTLATALQVTPQRTLMITRQPTVVRQLDVGHGTRAR